MAVKKKRRHRFLVRLVLLLNILAAILLLGGYSASLISPYKFWPPALLGLLVPYLFIINIIFTVFWIVRGSWWFILSTVIIVAGSVQLNRYFSFDRPVELKDEERYLKVISYNVKNLSNDNISLSNDSIRSRIFRLVRDSDPDIICMQEFMTMGIKPETLFESLGRYAGLPHYRYISYVHSKNKNKLDAIVTYSKFPVISSEQVKRDELRNLALATDILFRGDTVRVFNVHLESIHFQQEDYEFISEMPRPELEEGTFRESSWSILKKLRRAFRRRALQAEMLAEHIRNSPHPVILCGDFNDTPSSFTYATLTKKLDDAFVKSGKGTGNTYVGKVPSYRIDYILYSDFFQSFNYTTVKEDLSDHYMISTYLAPVEGK